MDAARLVARAVRCNRRWLARSPPPSQIFEAITGSQGQLVLPAILGFTQGLGGVVSGAIRHPVPEHLLEHQSNPFRAALALAASIGQRKQRVIFGARSSLTSALTYAARLSSLLTGLLLGIGYWLLGSPYPALLALAGVVASLIPVVGAVLAIIPPLLVGLLTSVQQSIFTVLYAVVVLVSWASGSSHGFSTAHGTITSSP